MGIEQMRGDAVHTIKLFKNGIATQTMGTNYNRGGEKWAKIQGTKKRRLIGNRAHVDTRTIHAKPESSGLSRYNEHKFTATPGNAPSLYSCAKRGARAPQPGQEGRVY